MKVFRTIMLFLSGVDTPAFKGTPKREGYVFKGWKPAVAEKVTGDVTYVAVWEKAKDNNGDTKPGDMKPGNTKPGNTKPNTCLLYTSDAADE